MTSTCSEMRDSMSQIKLREVSLTKFTRISQKASVCIRTLLARVNWVTTVATACVCPGLVSEAQKCLASMLGMMIHWCIAPFGSLEVGTTEAPGFTNQMVSMWNSCWPSTNELDLGCWWLVRSGLLLLLLLYFEKTRKNKNLEKKKC